MGELGFMPTLGIVSAYMAGRWAFFIGLFFVLHRVLGPSRKIAPVAYPRAQIRDELRANLAVVLTDTAVVTLVLAAGLVRFRAPTVLNTLFGFVFTYAFFEFWFYAMHRLMHSRLPRWIHRQHHRYSITSPLSALSLSPAEKLINLVGMVVIPGLATFALPISFEGIAAYHFYNFYVNVLGHSNLELLPAGFERTRAGRWIATSTYHSIHHRKGHRHFGLFTSAFDRAFGTFDESYRVRSGR